MQKQGLKLLINMIGVYILASIFSVIEAGSMVEIIVFSGVLWAIAIFLRPVLLLITLPINLFTFGIFSVITQAWIIMLADWLVKGVYIPSFWIALVLAILIMGLNSIFIVPSTKIKA